MVNFAFWLFWFIIVVAAGQIAAAVVFTRVLRRRDVVPPPEDAWPRAAVLMALRGADPQLADGLRRLLQQDYPNYEVRLIIDNESDPALAVAQSVRASWEPTT